MGQHSLDSTQLVPAGSLPANTKLQTKYLVGSVAIMPTFSPQNGETFTIAPAVVTSSSSYRDYEYQITLGQPAKQICLDYTVNGQPAPATISGPSYSGGNEYYIATENAGNRTTAKSTMYLRGSVSSKGVCDLVNGTALGGETLQSWKQDDGLVKETVVSVDPTNPISTISTEIGVQFPDGSTKLLVSPRASSNADFPATLGNDMVFDTGNNNYRTPSGNALVRFHDGTTKAIYADEDGHANTNIRADSLQGDWAIMLVGNKTTFGFEDSIVVNVKTKQILYPSQIFARLGVTAGQ
jgi:hypothetical protein